jgi:DNA polymerase-3 subunit alpha/error-prone DNA polymerase
MCMSQDVRWHYQHPCVNKSEYETTVYGVDVHLGFMQLGLILKQHIVSLQIVIRMENTNPRFHQSHSDRNRRDPNLDFHRCLPFYSQNKNQLLVIARLILVNYKPENRN